MGERHTLETGRSQLTGTKFVVFVVFIRWMDMDPVGEGERNSQRWQSCGGRVENLWCWLWKKQKQDNRILDVRLLFSKSALMGFGETIQIWGWSSISPGLSVSLYLANRELCRSLWVCLRTVWWAKCNSEEVLNPFAPGVELVRETLRKAVPAVSFPVNSKS